MVAENPMAISLMDIWMIGGCEHKLHFKMQKRESSSHKSLYKT
jgi:hypothetical protein